MNSSPFPIFIHRLYPPLLWTWRPQTCFHSDRHQHPPLLPSLHQPLPILPRCVTSHTTKLLACSCVQHSEHTQILHSLSILFPISHRILDLSTGTPSNMYFVIWREWWTGGLPMEVVGWIWQDTQMLIVAWLRIGMPYPGTLSWFTAVPFCGVLNNRKSSSYQWLRPNTLQ